MLPITYRDVACALRNVDNADSARPNTYEAGVRDGRRAAIREIATAFGAFDRAFDRAAFLELTAYGPERTF